MKTILRWLPATVLLGLFGFLWKTATSGGERGIVAWLTLMGGLPYLGMVILPFTIGVLVRKRRLSPPLAFTFLVSILVIWPYLWQFGALPMAYPISLQDTEPTATVRLPADKPLLVAWGGDTPDVNYHVTFPDSRWAYDLMIEPAFTGSLQLEDYGCWGVPILAPIAGEVVIAHDGEADVPINEERALGTPHQGNHIFIRIEGDTYIAIGHLQTGSIVVNVGDVVAEGDLLGKCGNSGSSSEPHIHIHHQREDPRVVIPGLAEGLPLYFRDHDGDPMPEGGLKLVDGREVPKGPILQHMSESGS